MNPLYTAVVIEKSAWGGYYLGYANWMTVLPKVLGFFKYGIKTIAAVHMPGTGE